MKNAMRIILVILLVLTVAPMMGCTSTIRMTGYTNPTYQAEPDKPLPELEPVGIILTNSKKCIRHYTGVYPALKDLDVGWRCVAYDDESGLTIALTADGTIGVYRPDGSNIAQAKCACCDDTHKCVAYSPGHEILVYAGGDIVYKVDIFADGATITPRYENVVDVVSFGEYLPETRFPDYYCASEAIKRITYRGEDSKLHTVNWDGK